MLRKTKIATALSQLKPLKVCVSAPQKSLAKSRHLLPLGALMTGSRQHGGARQFLSA